MQAQSELELRRKVLPAAGGLGARVPAGDGGTSDLGRVEALGRRRRWIASIVSLPRAEGLNLLTPLEAGANVSGQCVSSVAYAGTQRGET
jgi:hypothetical protein